MIYYSSSGIHWKCQQFLPGWPRTCLLWEGQRKTSETGWFFKKEKITYFESKFSLLHSCFSCQTLSVFFITCTQVITLCAMFRSQLQQNTVLSKPLYGSHLAAVSNGNVFALTCLCKWYIYFFHPFLLEVKCLLLGEHMKSELSKSVTLSDSCQRDTGIDSMASLGIKEDCFSSKRRG